MNIIEGKAGKEIDAVALQQMQYIYNAITEKTEKKVTFRSDSHIINLDCISNIHFLLEQMLSTWGHVTSNATFTQRLSDGTFERWSGFERMMAHAGAVLDVTVEIEIVYNILIKLPNIDKPSPYKITIGVRNTLHELTSIRDDNSDNSFDLYMLEKSATARWEIEFVDIAIARSIESIISKWYDSVPKERESFIEIISRRASNYISTFVRIFSLLILSWFFFGINILGGLSFDAIDLTRFIVSLYAVHLISTPLISRLSKSLKTLKSAASLHITSKDKDLYRRERDERFKNAIWVGVNLLIPLIPASVGYIIILIKEISW